MELLVSRGGNLLLGDRTPLYEATQEGHLEVAQYIVQQLKKNEKKEVRFYKLKIAYFVFRMLKQIWKLL